MTASGAVFQHPVKPLPIFGTKHAFILARENESHRTFIQAPRLTPTRVKVDDAPKD
jgi:hypothetical protein